jgi:hypothetical protein
MKKSILAALFAVAAIGTVPAGATTATFTFTGSTSDTNAYGDSLPFSSGGINVSVTAYNTTALTTTSDMNNAAVEQYTTGGLGVCGTEETSVSNCTTGSSSATDEQVDNESGGYEFLLFKFSTPVDLSSITIEDTSGSNMSMSYWTTSTAPPANVTSLTDTQYLSNFSAQGNDNCAGSGCSTGDSVTDTLSGNNVTYLLIAAAYNESGQTDDTFEVKALVASTPEPATFGMIGFALAGLGLIARKRKKS